jgi:hypothetical protein
MSQHATAAAREIEVKSARFEPKIGVARTGMLEPRPDLSGTRMKMPNQDAIYLVDPDGYRRLIPDAATYNNLFIDWTGIAIDIDISEIPESSALTVGAILATPWTFGPIYLVSNGMKRCIANMGVFDHKYFFNLEVVHTVQHVLLDFIFDGAIWT